MTSSQGVYAPNSCGSGDRVHAGRRLQLDDRFGDEGGSGAAGADDCVVRKKRVRLLNVDRSLTDDLARWLAPTDLRATVVSAPLVGLVHAVAAARPEELSRNDPVADTAAERQAAVLILIATDGADGPDVLLAQRAPKLRDHAGKVPFPSGAREDGDAGPPATAIREAAEETGVDPAAVEPLILLPRLHIPPSRFDVTRVLAHWRTPSPISATGRLSSPCSQPQPRTRGAPSPPKSSASATRARVAAPRARNPPPRRLRSCGRHRALSHRRFRSRPG